MLYAANFFQRPLHSKIRIIPTNAIIIFAIKFFCTFIRDDRIFKNQIAVAASGRNQNLIMLFSDQIKGLPLSERRTVFSQINYDIPYMPPDTPYQFRLLFFPLKMNGTNYTFMAGGIKNLCQIIRYAICLKGFL